MRSGWEEVLVLRPADAFFDEVQVALPASLAATRVSRLLLGPSAPPTGRATALEMLRLDGPALVGAGRDTPWLVRALEQAFTDGRLLALARRPRVGVRLDPASLVEKDEPAPEPAPVPVPVQPTTWIEIELLDTRGKPVPHEPFELVLSNGEKRPGLTDDEGLALVEDIPAGTCQVSFTGLDGREWKPR